MNEVDVERQRLYTRVAFTSMVIIMAIVGGIYLLLQTINHYSGYDATWIFLVGLTVIAFNKKIDTIVHNFYEKRLINSKKRNHTL